MRRVEDLTLPIQFQKYPLKKQWKCVDSNPREGGSGPDRLLVLYLGTTFIVNLYLNFSVLLEKS